MRQRWVAIVVVASTVTVAATCVSADLVECAGGISCPVGLRCVEDPALSQSSCASEDQFAACGESPTGTQCMFGDEAGTCFGGACIVEVCGDSIVQGREACDDGNTIGSDGCSSNCVSTEACGDGVIDLVQGEQCDDGVRGLSGDGCSSNCKIEYAFWRDVTPPMPSPRFSFGFTRSPNGGILMFGGTSGSGGAAQRATYDETWEHDGTTWGRLSPPIAPPPLTRIAMSYDPRRNRVVLFGGLDVDGMQRDETWEFDGVTWAKLSPTTKPGVRADAAFACSPTRCVLFGGRGGGAGSSTLDLADSWQWDGSDWAQIPTSGSGMPAARSGAGMTFHDHSNVFVLWGGHDGSGAHGDTYEMLDGASHWQIGAEGPLGTQSSLPAIAYSPATRQTWLSVSSGTYTYSSSWGSATPLSPRQDALAWNDRTQRLTATSHTSLDRTYTHEGSNWASRANVRPAGSRSAAAAYDTLRGLTMIYERLSGTWEWNGTTYRRALVADPMTAPNVEDSAMVFDDACGDVILFGGYNASFGTVAADTWRFDGATWQKLPIAGPPARSQHAMFYDPVRNATIVFGGATRTGNLVTRDAETWQLSGPCNARAWSLVSVPGPSARFFPAVAFDRARGLAVLFGGDTVDGNVNDVWEWNGTTWEQRVAAQDAPAPRTDGALGFEPRSRRVVLAGGRVDDFTRFADVWTWNGSEWTQLAPLVAPAARSGGLLVEDRGGSLVLYGGDTALLGLAPDLQRLRFDQALHPNERCQLASDDIDRDGLVGCEDPDCRSRCAPLCSPTESFATCTGPRCGDGECSLVEDRGLCPADCP